VNLAPRKMRGVFSEGMILMAENTATGELAFCATDEHLPNGAVLR
jgi:tRNA-binding EMAP/Myf-like protein